MNIFSYIRVSGKGQVDGDGPERQRQAIAQFCCTHKLDLHLEFFEAAVSGTVEGMDRPKFSDMLTVALEFPIKIDAIVVERVDRLARDLMVSELLLAECRKRNIKVFSVDQGNIEDIASNGGDPTRVLIRQIMGALAQWEKSVIVKKLRAARDRVKAKTGRCEGVKPFGTLNAIEASCLSYVKNLMPMAPESIAVMLNGSGFFTRDGKAWKRRSVAKLIKSKGL